VESIRRKFLLVLLFLIGFGLLALNSASVVLAEHRYGDGSFFLRAQVVRILIGIFLMFIVSRIDYHHYHRIAKPFLLGSLVLLLLLVLPFTKEIAPVIKGVRRWIVYPVTFQPSELARLALVLWCATTMVNKQGKIEDFKEGIFPVFTVLVLVTAIIAMEPDLSSAILCFTVVIVVLFLGKARLRHILAVGLIFGFGFLLAAVLTGYQLERILAIFSPDEGLLEENYHVHQSLISLGSGGWLGRGIGNGMQKYFFLPEPHTDSLFAAIGEEFGLLWSVGILLIYLFIGVLGYQMMMKCHDLLGFLLVGGIMASILIPVMMSIAINLGMIPAAGVGLPLISYGGSSMVTILAGIGIVLNVANQNRTKVQKLRGRR
jgi:cell division protein FtsW